MRSSRGFASAAANLVAPFGLAFASAPPHNGLTWLTTVSRRIIMQKARRQAGAAVRRTLIHRFTLAALHERETINQSMANRCLNALRPLVGMWFQVHYPPLVGVLPIFRSRYLVRYRSPGST